MELKKVLVACGTGGITSRNIAIKLEDYFKNRGKSVSTSTCKIVEVKSKVEQIKPDLVVSATRLPELGVPTVTATQLLVGINVESVYKEIEKKLGFEE